MSGGATRFLVNPTSGRGRGAAVLPRVRTAAGHGDGEVRVSDSAAHLTALAREAVADGVGRVVVVGGDGSLHHVVQALSGSTCALGVVPVGCGNDLAGSLGIPSRIDDALALAIGGETRRIDLGCAGDRRFSCTGGVGFDGEVARVVRERVRRVPGKLAYPFAALLALSRWRSPDVSVEYDTGRFEGRALFVVVANAPRFGGGMKIAPAAAMDDGLFDLVIVRDLPRHAILRALPKVYSGRHVGHPAIEIVRTRAATVRVDRPIFAYGDGEPMTEVGPGGVTFRILPGALSVVASTR